MAIETLIGQRSRKRIAPFHLHRPSTVDAALAAMASAGGGGAYMAGGLELVNRMKGGLDVSDIIHLGRIEALSGITATTDGIRIGAHVTHQEVAEHPLVRTRIPALAQCWSTIANIRVRCRGTIGGNLMARDPGFDLAPVLMALGATLHVATPDGDFRRVPSTEPGRTAALLVSVGIPTTHLAHLAVDRSLKPALSLAVALAGDGERYSMIRVAIGGAFAEPEMWRIDPAPPLSRRELGVAAADLGQTCAKHLPDPLDDWQASGGYRRRMIGVLVRRALERVAGQRA
jgi:carbon-monoxide dehydrogenase medium subunit